MDGSHGTVRRANQFLSKSRMLISVPNPLKVSQHLLRPISLSTPHIASTSTHPGSPLAATSLVLSNLSQILAPQTTPKRILLLLPTSPTHNLDLSLRSSSSHRHCYRVASPSIRSVRRATSQPRSRSRSASLLPSRPATDRRVASR